MVPCSLVFNGFHEIFSFERTLVMLAFGPPHRALGVAVDEALTNQIHILQTIPHPTDYPGSQRL